MCQICLYPETILCHPLPRATSPGTPSPAPPFLPSHLFLSLSPSSSISYLCSLFLNLVLGCLELASRFLTTIIANHHCHWGDRLVSVHAQPTSLESCFHVGFPLALGLWHIPWTFPVYSIHMAACIRCHIVCNLRARLVFAFCFRLADLGSDTHTFSRWVNNQGALEKEGSSHWPLAFLCDED